MITTEGTYYTATDMVLKFTRPDGTTIATQTARDESEMMRLIYFYNRLYIVEKLRSWLLQRAYAMDVINDAGRYRLAYKLIHNLTWYNQKSLYRLVEWVAIQEPNLRLLAPGEKSLHYNFFYSTIAPIIQFCKEQKGKPV